MKKHLPIITIVLSVVTLLGSSCTKTTPAVPDTTPPQVVSTQPANGATNVDPNLAELTVTFNESMLDHSWSWSYRNADQFPELNGDPAYTTTTTNVLPVKLQPQTNYVIWLNTETYTNFKDAAGNSLAPYSFSFTTK